jgi:predicted transposase YbfD/YdcC
LGLPAADGLGVTEILNQQRTESFRRSRCDYYESLERGHGRVEVRRCLATDDVNWLKERHDWPGLQSVILLEASRTINGNTTTECRYYLSSLPMDASQAAKAIRLHWQVENSLHWVLNVIFRNDDCRVCKDYSPQNFNLAKQFALKLIRRSPGKKSLRLKRKAAGWNDQNLLHILQAS